MIINISQRSFQPFHPDQIWEDEHFLDLFCGGCECLAAVAGGGCECPVDFDCHDPDCARAGLAALVDMTLESARDYIAQQMAAWGCLIRRRP